jgi:hypothetical protein
MRLWLSRRSEALITTWCRHEKEKKMRNNTRKRQKPKTRAESFYLDQKRQSPPERHFYLFRIVQRAFGSLASPRPITITLRLHRICLHVCPSTCTE